MLLKYYQKNYDYKRAPFDLNRLAGQSAHNEHLRSFPISIVIIKT